jgi:hypothetical protein
MVRDGETTLDQARDPLGGPQVGREAMRLRILSQIQLQGGQLHLGQAWFPTGAPGVAQGGGAAALPSGEPAPAGLVTDTEAASDLGFGQTLVEPRGGLESPLLQGFEITLHSSWVSHVP